MNVGSRVRVTVTRNHHARSQVLRGFRELVGHVREISQGRVILMVSEGWLRGYQFAFAPVHVKECPA